MFFCKWVGYDYVFDKKEWDVRIYILFVKRYVR